MRNSEVCEKFFNKEIASGSNLQSTGEKLFSYSTCIAEWDGAFLTINNTRYSVTTSKHLGYLRRIISQNMLQMYVLEANNVPRGTISLNNYV